MLIQNNFLSCKNIYLKNKFVLSFKKGKNIGKRKMALKEKNVNINKIDSSRKQKIKVTQGEKPF